MIAEHQMDKCLTTECIFVFRGLPADCLRFSLASTSRGQSPVVSFTTEHAETGFAGRGRRWEVFVSRFHRPFARGGAGDTPVPVPKGFLRTDFPRPAKRVSVCSVVSQPTVFVSILPAISRGQSPVAPSFFTTEHAETGFAGRGRRWEVFASRSHRPSARSDAGDAPVLDPKGFLRTDFPRPAKRVSVGSVVFQPTVSVSIHSDSPRWFSNVREVSLKKKKVAE